jgi:hypothetical protein
MYMNMWQMMQIRTYTLKTDLCKYTANNMQNACVDAAPKTLE